MQIRELVSSAWQFTAGTFKYSIVGIAVGIVGLLGNVDYVVKNHLPAVLCEYLPSSFVFWCLIAGSVPIGMFVVFHKLRMRHVELEAMHAPPAVDPLVVEARAELLREARSGESLVKHPACDYEAATLWHRGAWHVVERIYGKESAHAFGAALGWRAGDRKADPVKQISNGVSWLRDKAGKLNREHLTYTFTHPAADPKRCFPLSADVPPAVVMAWIELAGESAAGALMATADSRDNRHRFVKWFERAGATVRGVLGEAKQGEFVGATLEGSFRVTDGSKDNAYFVNGISWLSQRAARIAMDDLTDNFAHLHTNAI